MHNQTSNGDKLTYHANLEVAELDDERRCEGRAPKGAVVHRVNAHVDFLQDR